VLVALWRVGRGQVRRSVPWILITVGFVATLVADTLYALFNMPDVGVLGRSLDVMWLAQYAFIAAGAAHPDMVWLDADPEPRWTQRRSQSRILAIGAALAVPALLLALMPDRVAVAPLVVAVAGIVMIAGGVVRFSSAIARHRNAERTLAWQASHDALTGLLNRDALLEELDGALRHARRTVTTMGLLYLDLDDFKIVNDSLGHSVGDELLVAVAGRIRHAVREHDVVARLGGDEFVVVCDRLDHEHVAEDVAGRVVAALDAPFDVSGKSLHVSASIGIVHADGHDDPGVLLRDADLAMYLAKEQGRARVAVFDAALHARAHDRLVTDIALRSAVADEQLVLEFQPIVSLDSALLPESRAGIRDVVDNVVAYEALLRWDRPGHGRVGPDDFIPLAEATGVILDIGSWVASHAARQWREWCDAGVVTPQTRMSINLSPRQLRHADMGTELVKLVRAEGVDPSVMLLEITESGLLEPTDVVRANLDALREAGFRFAIDDFGTGYSSLANLKRLDVATIKIDRVFVDGLGRDHDDESLVRAIITMAHQLGISATAEGVERVEQLDVLIRLGCDAVQGYLTGRPHVAEATPAGPVAVPRDAA
jgi:diguanylate cyclase (GGDEF)-like protein